MEETDFINPETPKYTLRTLPKEIVKGQQKELETKLVALITELEESDISNEIKDKIRKLCRLYRAYCTEELLLGELLVRDYLYSKNIKF